MLRTLAALAAGLAAVAVATGPLAAHAADDPNAAAFVRKTNAERTSRGLKAYAVASDLAAIAHKHSAEMAARQSLYHNPNLGSEVQNWQVVGENVGDGGSVDSIHTAFMNSTEHRNNILATDYTQVGIGTVTDANGVIWVTEVFRLPEPTTSVPAPRTTTAARTANPVRVPTRTTVRPAPARPAVKAARTVALPVPVRPAAATLAFALAPEPTTTPADPFGQAFTFAAAMAALAS